MTYDAWLDSIDNESYIGMEIMLNDMQLNGKKHPGEAAALGFYKNNPLNGTDDVLSRLSGVNMVRRGNYAWEPTINGLSSGQINVTIDGMRMFGACTDKMDPVTSYIEPNNMESITVEKGGHGSEFGSTVGGSVDMKTRKAKFQSELSGQFGGRYESAANGQAYSGSLNYGSKRLAVRASGGFRKYQNYTNGDGHEVRYSQYQKANFSLASSLNLSNGNLVNLDILIDDARNVGYPALPMDVAFAKAKIFGLSYIIWEPMPLVSQIELKGYYNKVDHLMDDSDRVDVAMRMDMPGQTYTYGFYANATIEKDKHKGKAKFEYYGTNAYAEMTMFMPGETDMFMLTWPDVDRHNVGLYVADKIMFSHKTMLAANFRVDAARSQIKSQFGKQQFTVFGFGEDDFAQNDLLVNTGITLDQHLNEKLCLTAAASYGGRLPTVSEMFGFYLYNAFDGFDYVGNPRLDNETSIQLQAGVKYKLTDKLNFNFNGFHYWFNEYILGLIDPELDAMTIGSNGVKVYQNIDGVVYKGFDAELTFSPSQRFQMLLNSKYTHAQDGDGNPMPLIPPLKTNLTLVGNIKDFKIQAEGEWATSQYRINEEFGEQATPSYVIANIRFTQSFINESKGLEFSAGVENLFDEAYREHLDWGGILRPGRNIYFSVNYQF